MPKTPSVPSFLHSPAGCGDGQLTDRELVAGYASCGDQEAFALVVQRHGPMVLGVCRRVLHNHHDAEDAFQETLLVLVRKARSLHSRRGGGRLAVRRGQPHRG